MRPFHALWPPQERPIVLSLKPLPLVGKAPGQPQRSGYSGLPPGRKLFGPSLLTTCRSSQANADLAGKVNSRSILAGDSVPSPACGREEFLLTVAIRTCGPRMP